MMVYDGYARMWRVIVVYDVYAWCWCMLVMHDDYIWSLYVANVCVGVV